MLKINFTSRYKFFFIFLVINLLGYKQENNPAGMHPIRIKAKKLQVTNFLLLNKVKKLLKKIFKNTSEYPGIANLFLTPGIKIFEDEGQNKKVKNLFKNQLKPLLAQLNQDKQIKSFYRETYLPAINKLTSDKNNRKLQNLAKDTLKFLRLKPKDINLDIEVFINLLDSYSRGTNYFKKGKKYIFSSLTFKNKISWDTIRHEFLHLILKELNKKRYDDKSIKLPVNKDYAKDDFRTKLDEYLVRAINIIIITGKDKKFKDGWAKSEVKNGFLLMPYFVDKIRDYLVRKERKFDNELVDNLLNSLNEDAEKYPI